MNLRVMRNSVIVFGMIIVLLLVLMDSGIRYDGLKKELEALRAQLNNIQQHAQPYNKLQAQMIALAHLKFDFHHPILLTQNRIDPGTHTRMSWGNAAKQPYTFNLTPQQWIRLPQQDWTYHQFNNCALVGNDDKLLEQNYGQEIDTHDVIFRFKEAPTVGYEKAVGRKTHYRIAYAPSNSVNSPLEWIIENDEKILYVPTYKNVEGYWVPRFNLTTTNSFLIEPSFAVYANSVIHVDPWCTTGWVGFVLTFHVCEHLDLYGFSEHPIAYRRYYSPELIKSIHSKAEEENMMNMFDQLGLVRWRK